MTEGQWTQMIDVLNAMKSGLVRAAPGKGKESQENSD